MADQPNYFSQFDDNTAAPVAPAAPSRAPVPPVARQDTTGGGQPNFFAQFDDAPPPDAPAPVTVAPVQASPQPAPARPAAPPHAFQPIVTVAVPGQTAAPNGKAAVVDSGTYTTHEWGDAPSNEPVSRLTPEQHQQYLALARDPHTSAAALRAWAHAQGVEIANAEQVVEARNKGAGVNSNVSYQLPKMPSKGAAQAGVLGLGDAVSLGPLPRLGAVADALGIGGDGQRPNIWNSNRSFGDLYDNNLDLNRALIGSNQEEHPYAYVGGQLVGGMAIPVGMEGTFVRAEQTALALGHTADEARSIAAQAVRVRAAQVGGGTGAVYGFNSTDGDLGHKLLGGVVGGTEGAVLGHLTANMGYRPVEATPGVEAADAASRLQASGHDITLPPTVVGGPATQRFASGIAQTTQGGAVIARSTNKLRDQLSAIADRTATTGEPGLIPTTRDVESAATHISDSTVPGSLAAYEGASKAATDNLYGNAEQLAGDTRLITPNTINTLDTEIDRLRQVPGGVPGLSHLQDLREELASDNHTVAGLRYLRTSFGDRLDAGQRTVREAANKLWGPLSDDIFGGLRNVGKDAAADAYRAADQAYAQRASNLEDIVPRLLGKGSDASPEQVAANLVSLSRRDGGRLGRALDLMDEQSRSNTVGGLIQHLGDDGGTFNPTTFARNWEKMSDTTKRTVLRGPVRQDLNDLATIIDTAQRAGRMGNSSNTAGASNIIKIMTTLTHGSAGALLATGHHMEALGVEAGKAALGGAVSRSAGWVLTRPGVAKVLVG
jgi:hypothetical protein